jgi:septal ring factor EnvC (AmiA/AmiB activator)
MKIKESQLRELFKEVGLSEDIFDIFRSKRKKLDRKIKDLKSDLKDMEDSAPTKADRERLRKLNSTLQTALKSGGMKI